MSQQRYEREIEEIVGKTKLRPRVTLGQRIRGFLSRFNVGGGRLLKPTTLGLAGVILLIVGLIRGSMWTIIAGVVLMLAAYLLSIMRSKGTFKQETGYEKTWRGRKLDDR
ncbi:MAG: hypothetical protein FJ039_01975 [Chloroflexi bacterium]|nr:hypothetical protein [Chloroflexota bacterium]